MKPKLRKRKFKLDWVLTKELAIGPAPTSDEAVNRLKEERIKGVLSLCSREEAEIPENIEEFFICKRIVLPDHKSGKLPTVEEIESALKMLSEMIKKGPVFVHCVAGVERSPLVCMSWLVKTQKLSPRESLEYLMQVHKGTSPLPGQLDLLNKI